MSTKSKHLGSAQVAPPKRSAGRPEPGHQARTGANAPAGTGARTGARTDASGGAGTRTSVGAGAGTRASAGVSPGAGRQRARYVARRRLARWDFILLLAGAVVVALVVGSSIIGEVTTPKGKVAAAQTNYDFGDVPIQGGLITTRFPLAVEGDARAVDIVTT